MELVMVNIHATINSCAHVCKVWLKEKKTHMLY